MVKEVVLLAFQDVTNRSYRATNKIFTSIQIVNRGTASLSVIINGITVTVDKDEVYDERYERFSSFIIQATGPYEVVLRGVSNNE